jgi:nucleoid DNA-binding protein
MGRTQKVIADIISKELGLPQKTGRLFVQKLFDLVADDIVYTGRIELRGLGTFKTVDRPAQTIPNPSGGGHINVPAHKSVEYRASADLKGRLNSNK